MVNSFFTSLGDEVVLIRKVLPFALLWTKWGFSLSFTKKMENLAGCSPSQILFGFFGQKQVQIRVKRAYYSKTLAVDEGMFNTSSRSLIIYFMHSVLFFRLWSRTTIKSLCSKDHLLWKTPSSFGEDPCGMLSWRVRCKLYDNSLTLQSCQKINCLNIATFSPAKCKRCWSLLNQADVEVRFMSFTLQNNTFFCPESASHLNCKACEVRATMIRWCLIFESSLLRQETRVISRIWRLTCARSLNFFHRIYRKKLFSVFQRYCRWCERKKAFHNNAF